MGFCELLSWNSKEWYLVLIGCIASIIEGGSQPAFAVVFSKLLSVSQYSSPIFTSSMIVCVSITAHLSLLILLLTHLL